MTAGAAWNYVSGDGPLAIVLWGAGDGLGPGISGSGRAAESCTMATDRGEAPNESEDVPMATTAEVAAVVQGVQSKHRGRIRWSVGRHTAELALRALDAPPVAPRRPSSSKSRRRKRHKRLL